MKLDEIRAQFASSLLGKSRMSRQERRALIERGLHGFGRCPFCLSVRVVADEVDNGVGREQVAPAECLDCGAQQFMPEHRERPVLPAGFECGVLSAGACTCPDEPVYGHRPDPYEKAVGWWRGFGSPTQRDIEAILTNISDALQLAGSS